MIGFRADADTAVGSGGVLHHQKEVLDVAAVVVRNDRTVQNDLLGQFDVRILLVVLGSRTFGHLVIPLAELCDCHAFAGRTAAALGDSHLADERRTRYGDVGNAHSAIVWFNFNRNHTVVFAAGRGHLGPRGIT